MKNNVFLSVSYSHPSLLVSNQVPKPGGTQVPNVEWCGMVWNLCELPRVLVTALCLQGPETCKHCWSSCYPVLFGDNDEGIKPIQAQSCITFVLLTTCWMWGLLSQPVRSPSSQGTTVPHFSAGVGQVNFYINCGHTNSCSVCDFFFSMWFLQPPSAAISLEI